MNVTGFPLFSGGIASVQFGKGRHRGQPAPPIIVPGKAEEGGDNYAIAGRELSGRSKPTGQHRKPRPGEEVED